MPRHVNQTMTAFGYPDTLVADFDTWVALARPKQVTIGSLVLAASDPAHSFAALDPAVQAALGPAMQRVDRALRTGFACDKVNYLMLMMVDPHVHFHVIPRYATPPMFAGRAFPDTAWPKPPGLSDPLDLAQSEMAALRDRLKGVFAAA